MLHINSLQTGPFKMHILFHLKVWSMRGRQGGYVLDTGPKNKNATEYFQSSPNNVMAIV
jgi:hypothetical protein